MRLIARLLLGAVLWALLAVSPARVVVLSAQELWYQAYRAGVAAYQRGDWKLADEKLNLALTKRPMEGRAIRVPGAFRLDYLPKYYLALVCLQQERYQQALDLFEDVIRTRIVTERDPEFAELQSSRDLARRRNIDDFRERVVKIDALLADGEEQTGTGIVVNGGTGTVDVITALHVLVPKDDLARPAAPRSIRVAFFRGEGRPPAQAEWLGRFDVGLDLAAIRVKVSGDLVPRRAAWAYRDIRSVPIGPGEPVFTVGHAIEDWGASESNVVLSPIDDQESRRFVISAAGIAQRASGGPVIDNRGYLMGMMTALVPGGSRAAAVRVNEIVQLLAVWRLDSGSRPVGP